MDNEELTQYLSTMDLPSHRISYLNKVNVKWLYQNIAKRNSDNKHFDIVYKELERRVNDKDWRS